jgi:hypothetical protein
VSTILKALAKLEREKEAIRVAGPIPVISNNGPDRGGAAGWFLKPRLIWGLVGVIIIALGGTAWHFYRQYRAYAPRLAERSDTKGQPPSTMRSAAARDQAASPTIPHIAKQEPRQQERPSPRDQMPEPPPPPQKKIVDRQPTPPETSAGNLKNKVPLAAPESIPEAKSPVAAKKSKKVEALPAQPDADSKNIAPADVYENTPMLTGGRLRIHAIAWSPQPAERMAVINSRVIHEGDSVEDFTVVVIRPDDVVVREKGKGVWRVEFGRP